MDIKTFESPAPEVCASKIFEACGAKFDKDVVTDLWQKIRRHQWVLSEKLKPGCRIQDRLQRFCR